MRALLLLLSLPLFTADVTVPASDYVARRERLAKAIGPNSMLIMTSADPARRNGDVDWPYRQDDNLYYLTGVSDPGATLVLLPGEKISEVLFVRDRNPQAETWTGRIPTFDEIRKKSGVATVESNRRFDSFVSAAMQGQSWTTTPSQGYYADPVAPTFVEAVRRGDARVWLALGGRGPLTGSSLPPGLQYAEKIRQRYPEVAIRDAATLLRELREVKSAAEIAVLRRAIEITAEAQRAAMQRAQTATNEREIHAVIEATFLDRGACCWGFPSIVGAGANATTLHYESNDAPVNRNDLVLTDIGADVEGYTADVTRTYPASGKFTTEQRAIHDAVFKAQEAVIASARPGRLWRELQETSTKVLGEELLKLGLITKTEPDQIRMYALHGIGHPVGLQVHDVFRGNRPLEPAMVIAIEPGLYIRKEDVLANPTYQKLSEEERSRVKAVVERYAGIGVRIEDNVLITSGAPEILSSPAPRSATEIERFLAARQP